MAHVGPGDLPGEREPVRKAVRYPVRGKFRRQEQVKRTRFLAEGAELNRLDPLAVKLLTEILAKTLANVPLARNSPITIITRAAVILLLGLIDMVTPFEKKDAGGWMLAIGPVPIAFKKMTDRELPRRRSLKKSM